MVKDGEAWHAAVHEVTKSWTWLSNWTTKGVPGGSDGKESAWIEGGLSSILGLGRSPEGHGNPLKYSLLENPHGQAWQIQSIGLQRVGHDSVTKHSTVIQKLWSCIHEYLDVHHVLSLWVCTHRHNTAGKRNDNSRSKDWMFPLADIINMSGLVLKFFFKNDSQILWSRVIGFSFSSFSHLLSFYYMVVMIIAEYLENRKKVKNKIVPVVSLLLMLLFGC